jgi:hypothetical protein
MSRLQVFQPISVPISHLSRVYYMLDPLHYSNLGLDYPSVLLPLGFSTKMYIYLSLHCVCMPTSCPQPYYLSRFKHFNHIWPGAQIMNRKTTPPTSTKTTIHFTYLNSLQHQRNQSETNTERHK